MSQTFTNAKIFMGTDETSFASAMTIDRGRVTWVGNQEEVTDPAAIDLGGQTVLPGLIDCHTHPKYIADALHGVACTPPKVNSIADMIAALKQAPTYGQGPDVWIEGWGFDETKLAEHRAPTVDDLDQVSTTQPIFLYRSDCHSSVGNSRALELAGIDASTPDPVGGKIGHFADGWPNGFMREVAATQLLIREVGPELRKRRRQPGQVGRSLPGKRDRGDRRDDGPPPPLPLAEALPGRR